MRLQSGHRHDSRAYCEDESWPTLLDADGQGLLNYEYVRDNPEQLDDPSWQVGLPQSIIDDIKKSLKKPGELSYHQITPMRRPTLARKIAQLSESGVVLLIGTDRGIPMNFHSQTTLRELRC